jgi:hypothetical protein
LREARPNDPDKAKSKKTVSVTSSRTGADGGPTPKSMLGEADDEAEDDVEVDPPPDVSSSVGT